MKRTIEARQRQELPTVFGEGGGSGGCGGDVTIFGNHDSGGPMPTTPFAIFRDNGSNAASNNSSPSLSSSEKVQRRRLQGPEHYQHHQNASMTMLPHDEYANQAFSESLLFSNPCTLVGACWPSPTNEKSKTDAPFWAMNPAHMWASLLPTVPEQQQQTQANAAAAATTTTTGQDSAESFDDTMMMLKTAPSFDHADPTTAYTLTPPVINRVSLSPRASASLASTNAPCKQRRPLVDITDELCDSLSAIRLYNQHAAGHAEDGGHPLSPIDYSVANKENIPPLSLHCMDTDDDDDHHHHRLPHCLDLMLEDAAPTAAAAAAATSTMATNTSPPAPTLLAKPSSHSWHRRLSHDMLPSPARVRSLPHCYGHNSATMMMTTTVPMTPSVTSTTTTSSSGRHHHHHLLLGHRRSHRRNTTQIVLSGTSSSSPLTKSV